MAAEPPPPPYEEPCNAQGDFTENALASMAFREAPPPPPGMVDPWDLHNPKLGPFDTARYMNALHDAFEKGSDEDVVEVLTSVSLPQLDTLRQAYEAAHGSLEKRIKRKTSGNLEDFLLVLLQASTPDGAATIDAALLDKAMRGMGTNEDLLTAVLASRTGPEMLWAAGKYQELFRKPLVDAIRSEVGGDYAALCVALASGSRPADAAGAIDVARATAHAQALLEGSELASAPNRALFSEIFSTSAPSHLAAVAAEYQKISRLPRGEKDTSFTALETIITKKMGDNDYTKALRALLHPATAIAQQIRKAIDGAGTDDFKLQRHVARARGALMFAAKQAYLTLFKKPLLKDIEGDTGGDYRVALRRACAHNQGALVASIIRGATLGAGTTEGLVVDALTLYATNEYERFQTAEAFALDYGKPLPSIINSEMSGGLAYFLSALCYTRVGWDAAQLRAALKGIGSDESVLVDVIVARDTDHLELVKAEYKKTYGKELLKAVQGDVSGHFGAMLTGLLSIPRRDPAPALAESEIAVNVDRLYRATQGAGTRDADCVEVFSRYTPLQLGAIDVAYRAAHGVALVNLVEKELSGSAEEACMAAINPIVYASRQLQRSMKGAGTKEALLVRMLVHRTPAEFRSIDAVFNDETHKSVLAWVQSDVGGKFKLALTRYINSLLGLPIE